MCQGSRNSQYLNLVSVEELDVASLKIFIVFIAAYIFVELHVSLPNVKRTADQLSPSSHDKTAPEFW